MSGSVAGAEMTTFFAPASRCFWAPSRSVKKPVDSSTTSTPRSPHGSARGVALGEHPDLLAGRAQRPVGELDLALERPEGRVVAQEVRHRLRVAEVVQRDDLEVGAERVLRSEEVPPDAAEAVDADANSHLSSASDARSRPTLTGVFRQLLESAQASVQRCLGDAGLGARRELAQ